MAPQTFHYFLSLPSELRQEIYKLATPPRIVQVQEDPEDFEEFRERFSQTWMRQELDPSLAHFAFNWREQIPFQRRQPTLESFGFSAPPSARPWVPSTSTPEISLDWLGDHPEVAWELTREGYLYSTAPIPALLHTCFESRSTLLRWGYQLAFSTRSYDPTTWFNFDRDILFLQAQYPDNEDHLDSTLLSGGPWDIGQFDPGDLRRVRALALESSAKYLHARNGGIPLVHDGDPRLSAIVRLFGGLQELLIVEWTGKDVEEWHESPTVALDRAAMNCQRGPWAYIVVEEFDALLRLFDPESSHPGRAGMAERIKEHKQSNGPSAQLLNDMELAFTRKLARDRDAVLASNDNGSVTPWEIPKATMVHIMPQSMCQTLVLKRVKIIMEIYKLRTDGVTNLGEKEEPAKLASECQADEELFTASQQEEEAFSGWLEEEEALEQVQREEDELANWQEEGPSSEEMYDVEFLTRLREENPEMYDAYYPVDPEYVADFFGDLRNARPWCYRCERWENESKSGCELRDWWALNFGLLQWRQMLL